MPRLSDRARTARENGKKSKGPVTAEGKERAKYNALKLGLAAEKNIVLDDEEKEQLGEFVAEVCIGGEPRDDAESAQIVRVAFAKLRVWRCQRAEGAALLDAHALAREDAEIAMIRDAVELGRKLEFDPASVTEMPRGTHYSTLLAGRDAEGPEWLKPRLESTAHGAEWLVGQFQSLAMSLAATGHLDLYEIRLLIRLLGMRPENSHYEPGVGEIVVAAYLAAEPGHSLADYFQHVRYRSGGRPVRPKVANLQAGLFPPGAAAADGQDYLTRLIDGEIARLEELIKTRLAPLRAARLARAADRTRLDTSRRGDLNRRYENGANRELRKLEAELKELRGRDLGDDADDPADDAFGAADAPELASVVEFVSQNSPVGFVPRVFDPRDPSQPPLDPDWLMIEAVSFKNDRLRVGYDRLEDAFDADRRE